MTCVACGRPIPLPTADPFRCPSCHAKATYELDYAKLVTLSLSLLEHINVSYEGGGSDQEIAAYIADHIEQELLPAMAEA